MAIRMDDEEGFQEFLRNLLLIRKSHAMILCGSFFELPIQYIFNNLTDIDTMFIPNDVCAVTSSDVHVDESFTGKRLYIQSDDRFPGFVQLISVTDHSPYRPMIPNSDFRFIGCPSWKTTLGFGEEKYLHKLSSFRVGVDRVLAVRCPCWPKEVDEWKTRKRNHGWPPQQVIEKVVRGGCHFVPKPHPSNPENNTQWRFSFSSAELILIDSWTDVQKYIYHVLRMIKSGVVKACGGDEQTRLCSYHFKTLMLWECEEKPAEFWEDENLETSIGELLCLMIKWLIDKHIPNYFFPAYNMIEYEKNDFNAEIQQLLNCRLQVNSGLINTVEKAYPLETVQLSVTEKLLLIFSLIQVHENVHNPLKPETNKQLISSLRENSLFLPKALNLYQGIRMHIQSTDSLKSKDSSQEAIPECVLSASLYFNEALKCNDRQEVTIHFSPGESLYKLLSLLNAEIINHINSRESLLNEQHVAACGRFNDRNRKMTQSAGKLMQMFAKLCTIDLVDPFHLVTFAYRANFSHTLLNRLNLSATFCNDAYNYMESKIFTDTPYSENMFPILLTNRSSLIYDDHFQTVFGFITLFWSRCPSPSRPNLLVKISPAHLIKYLKFQSERPKRKDHDKEEIENFILEDKFAITCDIHLPFSKIFMFAVLCASCRPTA